MSTKESSTKKPKKVMDTPESTHSSNETQPDLNNHELPTGSMAELAGLLSAGIGEPVAGEQTPDLPPEAPSGLPVDTDGEEFDPAYHASNPDGTPKLTRNGRFRKQTGAVKGNKAPIAQGVEPSKTIDPAKVQNNAKMATFFLEMGATQIATSLLGSSSGQEFKMEEKSEKPMIEKALHDYFLVSGLDDIPPGWFAFGTIAMYLGVRFLPGTETEKALGAKISSIKEKRRAKNQVLDFPSREEAEAAG
jgi:hypothetical protein